MKDLSSYEKMLKNDPRAGKLVETAMSSPEGQRLAQMFDVREVENAAKSGDMQQLKDMLSRVLSTPEGKSLAEKVQKAMQDK